MIRADAVIMPVTVEIAAVITRMIEHAVQDDADAAFLCRRDERFKVLFRAQKRIDFHIIARIVAVIGDRFKDRIEINDRDVQGLQIVQF